MTEKFHFLLLRKCSTKRFRRTDQSQHSMFVPSSVIGQDADRREKKGKEFLIIHQLVLFQIHTILYFSSHFAHNFIKDKTNVCNVNN